ncbi:MAG: bifunctional demethylmenaquinone methyltransferase/2-methoxy-6-polyprenyl-1,4-benzoquinol methylase UbiE [Chthonomonas sp.]|nr:bifunctional demethylmenaquinone methyltransferase/2-methoxy-6-polyprenyl-1,4-benzoquinol methylase UbiE [Chthonomonas sp.]
MNLAKPTESKKPWLTQGEEKRQAVQEMFGNIAPSYDRMNRLMTANLDRAWRRTAVRTIGVEPGEVALDLCCGTGDFISILELAGARVVGIDFCLPMLAIAKGKSQSPLSLGDACQLPLATASFDVVTVGWGIRNVPDIDRAHREIARVLKPGGRFVSIDMAIPRQPWIRAACGVFTGKVLPKVGALLSNREAYEYLPESAQRFMSREDLRASMEAAGFKAVKFRDFAFGNVCMHWGVKE